jgi:hypothetical protein
MLRTRLLLFKQGFLRSLLFSISSSQPPGEEHKTTFSAPKILSPRFRRLPLQSVNLSETESLCDSPTGNFRPFHTPNKDGCSEANSGDMSRRVGAEVCRVLLFYSFKQRTNRICRACWILFTNPLIIAHGMTF